MIELLDGGALASLVAFERLAGAETCWTRALLADPAREVWGLRPPGEEALAGYCLLAVGVFDLELEMLQVAPTWRRRGFAAALLEHCAARAVALGKERLLLEVRVSNHAAIALYRRAGYIEDGVRRGYYSDPSGAREDALLMSWRAE